MIADDRLDEEIRGEIKDRSELTPFAVRRAMGLDFEQLIKDARSEHELILRRAGQVVLLLDDVEDYGPLISAVFASTDGLLQRYGAGSKKHPVPVVLNFLVSGPETEVLGPVSEERSIPSWLTVMALKPFAPGGEDMLAYEQILLHPFRSEPRDVADRPWAFADVGPEVERTWEERFHNYLEGKPGKFVKNDYLYILADWGTKEQFVIEADDEPWLREVPRA
jgi:hypothetical protein